MTSFYFCWSFLLSLFISISLFFSSNPHDFFYFTNFGFCLLFSLIALGVRLGYLGFCLFPDVSLHFAVSFPLITTLAIPHRSGIVMFSFSFFSSFFFFLISSLVKSILDSANSRVWKGLTYPTPFTETETEFATIPSIIKVVQIR